MNIGAVMCSLLGGLFLLMGLLFTLLGDRAAMLISGFNDAHQRLQHPAAGKARAL